MFNAVSVMKLAAWFAAMSPQLQVFHSIWLLLLGYGCTWGKPHCKSIFLQHRAQGWVHKCPKSPCDASPFASICFPTSRLGHWKGLVSERAPGGIRRMGPLDFHEAEMLFIFQGRSWVCFPTPKPQTYVCPRFFPDVSMTESKVVKWVEPMKSKAG